MQIFMNIYQVYIYTIEDFIWYNVPIHFNLERRESHTVFNKNELHDKHERMANSNKLEDLDTAHTKSIHIS